MKTTIELPDELFFKVKVFAAEQRCSLKEVLTQALQRFIQSPPEAEEANRKRALKKLLKAMRAQNTEPMIPLTRGAIYAER